MNIRNTISRKKTSVCRNKPADEGHPPELAIQLPKCLDVNLYSIGLDMIKNTRAE